ncbi:MAG: MYXO-CTERM sorting domain-containing protein [Nannocystaceae bacterium]|nr:MYXO-CTERM sorting domain-containing protein [bacterium]
MKKIALLVGVLTALVGTEAHAETDSDNFNPQHTFRPNEFPWESGPINLIFGVSVNLTAAAYHEVDLEMLGQGEYDFDAQTLTFTGDADGGTMENALGVEIGVVVDSPLGMFDVGIYNIEETADGTFSPYLLPGDTERPFGVDEAIGPNDLFETAFSILSIDITLDIDWQLNIPGIEYQSTRILLTDGEDSVIANEVGVYDAEDDALDLILPDVVPGETSTMYATLEGEFDAEVAFIFIINATVNEVPVGPIEVPLDYPVNEGIPVEFPVEVINFDVPEAPEPGTTTGDEGSSTGDEPAGDSSGDDSDSDSDGTTTGIDPDPTTGDMGDGSSGGGLPAAPDPSDSGCGCTTSNEGGGFAWVLGLFGLTMLRRRRD